MASRRKGRMCQLVHVIIRHLLVTAHTCSAAVNFPCRDVIHRWMNDGICWRKRFPVFCDRWVSSEFRFLGCDAVYSSSYLRWPQENFFSKSRLHSSVYLPVRMSSLPSLYIVPEYESVNVCMCVYIYLCICIYIHTYIHVYIHTSTHTHTHPHTQTYIYIVLCQGIDAHKHYKVTLLLVFQWNASMLAIQ